MNASMKAKTNQDKRIAFIRQIKDKQLRKKMLEDVQYARETGDTKTLAIIDFVQNLGMHHDPAAAINDLVLKGRQKTAKLHACAACGTRHGDTYICSTSAHKDSFRYDLRIGHQCMRKHLVRYGLNAIVVDTTDKRTEEKSDTRLERGIDLLIERSLVPQPLIDTYHQHRVANLEYLRNQMNWLKGQDIPDSVREAMTRLRDPYRKKTAHDIKRVLDTVAKKRKFPADVYKGIADDLSLMGHAAKARQLTEAKELTAAQVERITRGADYRRFRIEQNEARLRAYAEPFDAVLLTALFMHSREKLRQAMAFAHGLTAYDAGIDSRTERAARVAGKRWTYGITDVTREVAQKARNVAVRIEPVKAFGNTLEQLVVLRRKYVYLNAMPDALAPKQTMHEPSRAIECLLNIDGMIAGIEKTYSLHNDVTAARLAMERAKTTRAYGFVADKDSVALMKAYAYTATLAPLDAKDAKLLEKVRTVLRSGMITKVDWLPDHEKLARDDILVDPKVFEGKRGLFDGLAREIVNLFERTGLPGTEYERAQAVLKDLAPYQGKRFLHLPTFTVEQRTFTLQEETHNGITRFGYNRLTDNHAWVPGSQTLDAYITQLQRIVTAADARRLNRPSWGYRGRKPNQPAMAANELQALKNVLADTTLHKEIYVDKSAAAQIERYVAMIR